jgi:plasmid replication initiation protein
MSELLRQDNRLTSARYELSLIEKRVYYQVIREVRKQFVIEDTGQRDLFNDLIVRMNSTTLVKEVYEDNKKEVKKALKSLRLRSFEWEDEKADKWFEVGFINYGDWDNGYVEVQVSKKILPFLVELTKQYTEYSLSVAMGLKSKWSQRMYELCCQFRSAGGFILSVEDLRERFLLEDKYEKYAALKSRVLEVAQKELKELYDKGQCDLYFNYSEQKNGRKIESFKFKIVSSGELEHEVSLTDMDYFVRSSLSALFETSKKPKNKVFINTVMSKVRLNPDDLKRLHKRIQGVLGSIPAEEQARYMRYVLKEDYLDTEE